MIIICCSFRGSMTQKPLLFSFLKVQSKYTVHKVIISKYFIWSWYSIHFVSLHHSYHHHHHLPIIMQQSIESFNLPPLPFPLGNPQAFDQFSSKPNKGRGGIEPCLTTLGNLNQKRHDFIIEYVLYWSLTVEVFKVNNALLLTDGLEGKSL